MSLDGWRQAHSESGSADAIFGFHGAVEKGTEPVEKRVIHVSQWVFLEDPGWIFWGRGKVIFKTQNEI
jgi:hypothetical protein